MKKLILMMIVMGLFLTVSQVLAKGKGSGDSGKGGFGDLGDGCVTFVNPAGATVSDDEGGRYCNGSDGQVSVPVHLRFDTKKFNKGHRWFWVEGICSDYTLDTEAQAQCDLLEEGYDGLMTNVTVVDDYGVDLNWTEMGPGDVLDARMGIKIDNSHFLYFGPLNCPERDPDPVYVRCDADTGGDSADGLCDKWTISTDPDFPTIDNEGSFDESSSACFKSGAYGTFYSEVEMNFTMEVCVMGVSC